jgi:ADP-heptose:LPS heptosyltransferase
MGKRKTKFLIIRFSSIGDIVLTTPLVRCLKLQYPDAEIHYVVKKKFAMVLEHNPYIDHLHVLDGNLNELVSKFREEQFDYIIDLHKTLRSYLLRVRLWRKTLSFRKLSVEKFLMTKLGIDLLPRKKHVVSRILDSVAPLGVTDDGRPVDYFLSEEERFDRATLPEAYHHGYIAFVIGGQHFTKRLPYEKIRSICERLTWPVVLLGGPEDADSAQRLSVDLGNKVYNLCGKLAFNTSVSVMSQAQTVIAHDTGLMHISGAFNLPIVSVWGATSPDKFGVWPYLNERQVEAKVEGLSCNPCSNFGTAKCPKGHFKCMWQQDEAFIAESASRMMQQ